MEDNSVLDTQIEKKKKSFNQYTRRKKEKETSDISPGKAEALSLLKEELSAEAKMKFGGMLAKAMD